MKRLTTLIIAIISLSAACFAQTQVLNDPLDGSTAGKANGVTFAQGKDGQAVVLDSPTDTIEYPAKFFPLHSGRIEMDFKLTQSMGTSHRTYGLLSDVGSGSAGTGSMILYWHENHKELMFGIFSGGWNWVTSGDLEFQADRWHHLALTYGAGGMSMAIDGRVTRTSTFSTGLSNTPKRLGFYDGNVLSPPVAVDNFRTWEIPTDHMELGSYILCPNTLAHFDTCKVTFGLAERSTVSLNLVKDGKTVKSLIGSKQLDAGNHSETLTGKGAPDGDYLVEMLIKNSSGEKKLSGKLRIDSRWRQDNTNWSQGGFFPTGVWYYWDDVSPAKLAQHNDPKKAAEYYDRTLRDLKEHGVNLIVFCWIPKEHRQMLLAACNRYGIKALVNTDDITSAIIRGSAEDQQNLFDIAWNNIKDIKDDPALYGYYIFDEPGSNFELTERIARAKQVLEVLDPKHPSFMCLLGGYEHTLQTVECRVLLIDIYTLWENGDGNMAGYIAELERGVRNAGDRPLWIITQGFGKKGAWKVPTPEECRAQSWIALAYGAKGLIWFLYQTTPDGEFLQGMTTLDGKPMDGRWSEAAKVHSDIKKLAPTLLGLKRADFPVPVQSDKVIAKPFASKDGVRYVIIANKDTKHSAVVRWTGDSAVDVLTGAPVGRSITLEPGGGRVVRM